MGADSDAQYQAIARTLNSRKSVACTAPWTRIEERGLGGHYTLCAWLDTDIGVVPKDRTGRIGDLWNSPRIQSIRRTMAHRDPTRDGPPPYCSGECFLLNSGPDFFLDYEDHEYAAFEPAFLDNLRAVARSIEAGSVTVETKPLGLKLHPSNACNLRCRMCNLDKSRQEEPGPAYFEGIKGLLPYLNELCVYGGEPFASPATRSILFHPELAAHRQLHLSTLTNGTILGEEELERLSGPRLGRFHFSIDGAQAETYEFIRRGASFTRVMANVRRFLDHRDRGRLKVKSVGAHFVVQAANLGDIPDFVGLCHDLGMRAAFSLVTGSLELADRLPEVELWLARGLARAERLGMDYTALQLMGVLDHVPAYAAKSRRRKTLYALAGLAGRDRVVALLERHRTAKRRLKSLFGI